MKSLILILFMLLTTSFNHLYASKKSALETEKFKEIAKNLYAAQSLVPDEKFEFSSNISLGVYFLRYLGDLGKFTLDSNEISKLIIAIEKLYDDGVNQTLKSLLCAEEGQEVTYFNLQGLMNKHFVKKNESSPL